MISERRAAHLVSAEVRPQGDTRPEEKMKKSAIAVVLALAGGCEDEQLQRSVPETVSVELEPEGKDGPAAPMAARPEPSQAIRDEQAREEKRAETLTSARAVERANERADDYVAPRGLDDPTLQGSQKADRARATAPRPDTRGEIVSDARAELDKLNHRTSELHHKLSTADTKAASEAKALLSKVPAQRKAVEVDLQALETVKAANLASKRVSLERRLATLDDTLDQAESKL
jgi:hypothetical protein